MPKEIVFDILYIIVVAIILVGAAGAIYDGYLPVAKWLFSKKDKDALSDANWEEKMNESLKAKKLTEDEVEKIMKSQNDDN